MFNKPLAFFVYAYNLAETTRAIEIAKALREQKVEIHFFTHGGTHEKLITNAGFNLISLLPLITQEKHDYLMEIDQGRRIGHPYGIEELMAHVTEEVKALKTLQPIAVYTGSNFPSFISARAIDVPLIFLLPLAGSAPYFQKGVGIYPEMFEFWITKQFPQSWKDKLFNWIVPRLRFGLRNFNRVAKSFGLPPWRRTIDLWRADLNLLTDLPELTGLPATDLPINYHYVGPVFAYLSLPVPDDVHRIFSRPGLKIFCAMGSSTPPSVLREVVSVLCKSNYNIVIATTSILDPNELQPLPENVYATRYLPAPQVNEMADLAIIHGGQGTVQTALWSGTPIIGVALQLEQQSNLDMIVKAGIGKRIPLKELSEERLKSEIQYVSQKPEYRKNALRIQQLVRSINGSQKTAGEIISYLEQHTVAV